MVKSEIGAIAVTRKWKKQNFINGIITERDIIQKVATLDRNPAETLVSSLFLLVRCFYYQVSSLTKLMTLNRYEMSARMV